jgi:hypothetical protein
MVFLVLQASMIVTALAVYLRLPGEGSPAYNASVLQGLLPGGDEWQGFASTLGDRLNAKTRTKAVCLLVASAAHPGDCKEVSGALAQMPAGGPRCTLTLNGSDASVASAGQLQAQLVSHLKACPQGLVILHDALLLPFEAWNPLFNMCNNQGGFTAEDGFVDAMQAALVVVMKIPEHKTLLGGGADGTLHGPGPVSEHLKAIFQDQHAKAVGVVDKKIMDIRHGRIDFGLPATRC